MDVEKKKSVVFNLDALQCITYDASQLSYNSDFIRESHKRLFMERSVFKRPQSQLQHVCHLIESWRHQDISVVFGNLGRQPFLLSYYLDLCFTVDDAVQIVCDWDLSLDYQTHDTSSKVDFLIRVEPSFGFTLHKPSRVKHLVVLTSHMNVCCWGNFTLHYYHLYLSDAKVSRRPDPHLQHEDVFKPPLFHTPVHTRELAQTVLLDVSDSRTAHEAYLRLLTGQEMMRHRSFNIRMTRRDEDILKFNMSYGQTLIQDLWDHHRWKMIRQDNPLDTRRPSMGSFLYDYLHRLGPQQVTRTQGQKNKQDRKDDKRGRTGCQGTERSSLVGNFAIERFSEGIEGRDCTTRNRKRSVERNKP